MTFLRHLSGWTIIGLILAVSLPVGAASILAVRQGEQRESRYLQALARSALFRPGGNPRAWLFAIMHNVFVNQVRSASSRRTVALDPESMEVPGQDRAHEGLSVRDIERALSTLPAEQREVVLLVGLEALSYADTARVIGVPIGTVMSRLSRGRERLRTLIDGAPEAAPLKVIK